MAEVIARDVAERMSIEGIEFGSAGVSAYDGSVATSGALNVAIERGLDLSAHRSTNIESLRPETDTIFLAMTPSHLHALRQLLPDSNSYLLSEFATDGEDNSGVIDPFGGNDAMYRDVASQIEAYIIELLKRFKQNSTNSR